MWLSCFTVFLFVASSTAETCRNGGGQIYSRGVGGNQNWIVWEHNKYREKIARDQVPGQPRGINLRRMRYDDVLANKCKVVSDQCRMNHIMANDNRFDFGYVGQNIYMETNSQYTTEQNWDAAVAWWFNENTQYRYPNGFNTATGHYTQIVWADTYLVGCDFIFYYDNYNPSMPYTKLYTCNYGPGGNFNNLPPYKTGRYGCENLC